MPSSDATVEEETGAAILSQTTAECLGCAGGAGKQPRVQGISSLSPLTQLFRSQYRQLLRFCRIRVVDCSDAEDIVQAAFLKARRAYPDKGIEELRPLLFTLVRNGALDFVRSGEHRRRQISVELGEVADQVVCLKTASPEQQVIDADHLAIVETLMAAMPARRREALRLHRIEGLTHAEIARRLSITRQTVIMDIAEAVAELAEGLARAERRRIPPGE